MSLVAPTVALPGWITNPAHASDPTAACSSASTTAGVAQFRTDSDTVGLIGASVLRSVSRNCTSKATRASSMSNGRSPPPLLEYRYRIPVAFARSAPDGAASTSGVPPDCGGPATQSVGPHGVPMGNGHTSTTTWSAPAGNRVSVPTEVRSNRSNVAVDTSATASSRTCDEVDEALRAPTVIVLVAPDWASAAAGSHCLVATGRNDTGTIADTSTLEVSGSALLAVTWAVLEIT